MSPFVRGFRSTPVHAHTLSLFVSGMQSFSPFSCLGNFHAGAPVFSSVFHFVDAFPSKVSLTFPVRSSPDFASGSPLSSFFLMKRKFHFNAYSSP